MVVIQEKPYLLKLRSCNLYVLLTVSMSLFTDMLVYNIIVPIMPFSIDAIHNGKSPATASISYHSEISNSKTVAKDVGVLLALFSTGLLVGSPLLGYLADKMSRRQIPMLVGIFGLVGATILFLFATKYWELLLARFLQGFSDACVWTLGMCLVADTFPIEELGTQMGRVLVFHSVGLVIGSPVGALYQHAGYKAPFILCIVLACIDLLLRIFLVERRNRPPEWFSDDATPKATPTFVTGLDTDEKLEHRQVTYFQLLRQPRLIAGLILAFSNGWVCSIFEPTLTVRLSIEWGYNASQIGLVFLAQIIPTFLASPISGILSDKFGPKVVCFTNLMLCAISMFLIGLPSHDTPGGIIPLILIFAIQGFSAFSFVVPVLSEMAYVVQEQNPGGGDSGQCLSYALFNIAFALGGLVGPLAGGYLFYTVGFFYMCITIGCFLIVCSPYIFMYTGPKGNFIVRPQDRVIKADEEVITYKDSGVSIILCSSIEKLPPRDKQS